jgi:hypothetical protein
LFRQITLAPGPTGSRFIDEDPGLGGGVKRAHEWVNVGVPGADRAKVDDVRIVRCGDRGHRHGLLVDIQTNVEGASVTHG